MVNRFPNMALAGELTRQDWFRNSAFIEISVILEPK